MNRVFFAHPKAWPDERVDGFVAAINAALADTETIAGRDDYQRNIASEGHISAWIRSVTRRLDTDTGRRFYRMVVVPEERIGKATADIVRDAVAAGIPVVHAELDGEGAIGAVRAVTGVVVVDAEDYFTGWMLALADT